MKDEREKFNNWIERFLMEKGIDRYEMFTIEKNGEQHIFEIGHVIDMMKITNNQEQKAIKDTLVRIDFENGNIRNYIKHLANALIDTYNKIDNDDIEEETI